MGSPPPMRGKANRSTIFCTLCGITPAYAGKRSIYVFHNGVYRDHPRLCGEKHNLFPQNRINHRITPAYAGKRFEQGDKTYNVHGSPPPMRGKAWLLYHRGELFRITPAYAGKSADRQVVIVRQWDHPRLCGEKKDTRRRKWRQSGSPPPMRGKEQMRGMSGIFYRITPAYAGKRLPECR